MMKNSSNTIDKKFIESKIIKCADDIFDIINIDMDIMEDFELRTIFPDTTEIFNFVRRYEYISRNFGRIYGTKIYNYNNFIILYSYKGYSDEYDCADINYNSVVRNYDTNIDFYNKCFKIYGPGENVDHDTSTSNFKYNMKILIEYYKKICGEKWEVEFMKHVEKIKGENNPTNP